MKETLPRALTTATHSVAILLLHRVVAATVPAHSQPAAVLAAASPPAIPVADAHSAEVAVRGADGGKHLFSCNGKKAELYIRLSYPIKK